MTGEIHNQGDLVGERYRVIRYLNEGGMQEVYVATDELLQRQVALKAPKEPSGKRRFNKSAVAAARVNHNNVAKTLDYVDGEERPYLVEELVDGKDLGRLLKRTFTALPPTVCARAIHQMAKGVCASHNAGVIHRDLKPSNVMVAGAKRLKELKITDFGIAKMAEVEIGQWAEATDKTATTSRTVMGAVPYMAPESIRSFKSAGMPSDIWAVAAIAYEMLAGEKPFGEGLMAIPNIVSGQPPEAPSAIRATQFKGLGEALYELLADCFASKPEKRPSAAQLVSRCEELCYSIDKLEFGTISSVNNRYWGFAHAERGEDVFWHKDSFYGEKSPRVGERICFVRHRGGGNDRAFPIVKLKQPES